MARSAVVSHKEGSTRRLHCILNFQEKSADVLSGLVFAIGAFLHRSLNWIDLKRDMHKSSLTSFVPFLLKSIDNEPAYRVCISLLAFFSSFLKDEALMVLSMCLRHFPQSLKTQQSSIRQLCWRLLSSNSYDTRQVLYFAYFCSLRFAESRSVLLIASYNYRRLECVGN